MRCGGQTSSPFVSTLHSRRRERPADARNIGLPPPRFKQNRTWPLKKRPKAIDAARAGGIRRAIALEVTMHRLFVALEPPAAVRHQLLDLMGGIANARWQTEAHVHPTLRFIGEVDRHRSTDVAAEPHRKRAVSGKEG